MSATVTPRRNAVTLMRPRSAGVTSIVSRAVKGPGLRRGRRVSGALIQRSASPGRAAKRASGCRDRSDGHRTILATSAASAAISRGRSALRRARGRAGRTVRRRRRRRAGRCAGEHRRIVIGERFGRLAGDDRARGAAVQDEARGELRDDRCAPRDERQHLGRCPAVERRRLHGDQHEIGSEQRRAHQASDTRRPVDDDMIGVRAISGASRWSVSRARPTTPNSRRQFSRARCCDQSSAEPCGSASISVTRLPCAPTRRRDEAQAWSCRRRPSG